MNRETAPQLTSETAPSKERRFRRTTRLTAELALLASLAGGLSACGDKVDATPIDKPAASADATSHATPEATASPSATPEATPTTIPEVTSTPEATSEKFEGAVNYDRFTTEWDSADTLGREAICAEFFDANIPKREVPLNEKFTGIEAVTEFSAMINVLSSLNGDRSDPRNADVSLKLAECITVTHEPTEQAKTWLTTQLNSQAHTSFSGIKLRTIQPDTITRYSDGLFEANGTQHEGWRAMTVEGALVDDLGSTPQIQVYEFHDAGPLPGYRLALSVPVDTPVKFGNVPPVILDQSRANAPWQG